jgi:hypothetical protein
MKQFLLKIAGYGLMSFLILNGIAFLSLFLLGKSNFYKPQFVKNGVVEKEFDYVILGSSTGLTTLDTKLIDSITGKKGLNISMDDSGLSSQYLMLLLFYALQKKIKCLVLAITPWDMAVSHPVLNDNDYRFLPNVNEKCVFDYYKNLEQSNFKVLTFSKYFPIIGVFYYNTELFYPSIVAALQPKERNQFDDKGNFSYPVTGGPKETGHTTTNLQLKNPYFRKIKQFCLDHDIKLLLYQSPMYKTKVVTNDDQNVINHSDLLKDSTLFYDNIHVNSKGRRICSEQFADYLLIKNYNKYLSKQHG